MAEVDFPSPSIFLQDIHHRAQPPTPLAQTASRSHQPKKNAVGKRQREKTSHGKGKGNAPKPKQTKSRDGVYHFSFQEQIGGLTLNEAVLHAKKND